MKKWIGYQKGVNLGGWFSQCDYSKDRFDNFIMKEDLAVIAGWGCDHIRLPIDYNLIQDDEGNYIEEGFVYIQKVVDWCEEYKLNMILDLHKTYGYSFDKGENQCGFFDSEELQERFYKIWEELSRRYGKYKNRIAFELLNEITLKDYKNIWNKIADTCIKRIRAIEPDIDILVGGYYNSSIISVPDLLPPQDEHIIYNFHSYDPIIFTHQGAYWVDKMEPDYRIPFDINMNELIDENNTTFGGIFGEYPYVENPEKPLDARFFRALFAEAIQVAEDRNVALYCGEYGVINLVNPEDTLKWLKAINEVFVENGIGRAIWSYKEMDFGLIDEHLAPVLDELIKYL